MKHGAERKRQKTGRRKRKEENNSGVCIRIKITDYNRQIHERIEIFLSEIVMSVSFWVGLWPII
jgi:hypothetical protein